MACFQEQNGFNFKNILFHCRDGSFLVTGSGDGTARVFTVQTPGR